jgi:hypothetical protein
MTGRKLSKMAKQTYVRNSPQKDIIRQKWLEFINEFYNAEQGLSLLTFPSEELHELTLYQEKGLINWEEMETGGLKITRGKVVCFEKESLKFKQITTKLINAKLEYGELGSILRNKYQSIMNGSTNIFPVDMVNLDYDGCISKINVPISETIERIFQFQARHQKSFSFFMTWPHTEKDDLENYKQQLRNVINDNLTDPSAIAFKNQFNTNFNSITALNYEQLSMIGMVKIILRNSAQRRFKVTNSEMFTYGGKNERKRMFSILLNFQFVGEEMSQHQIYSEDVINALKDIEDLNKVR